MIQLAAPNLLRPSTSVTDSRPMARAAMSQRSFCSRAGSAIQAVRADRKSSPRRMATSCFTVASGAEEAVTARERVDRKKAMVSSSNPRGRRRAEE